MLLPRFLGLLSLALVLVVASGGCGRLFGPDEPNPTPGPGEIPATGANLPSPNSYLAVVPGVLRAGHTENISLSLFRGDAPATGDVRLALMKDDQPIAETTALVRGSGDIPLAVPQVANGDYEVEISGPGFRDTATLQVEEGTLVFLETDKPIYKPGQTIHIRVLSLDTMLKPWPADVTIEVQDAKGIKVFKEDTTTDEYGMASIDLPLSTEPNLGVWKITGKMGERTVQLDVRVEEYVLPKYEVNVETQKDWVLANERITGSVSAEYTFGKPVVGEVEIKASRYVGQWEEYATFSGEMDGTLYFELPPVQFVAGVPGSQGMGNVTLDVTVRESATGYEEKTTHLLTVAATPVNLTVIPESSVFKPSLPMSFLVIIETPDGTPLDESVQVTLSYMGKDFDSLDEERVTVQTTNGKGMFQITPPEDSLVLTLEASAEQAYASLTLQSGYSPSANFIHVEQVAEGQIEVGDTVTFHVASTREASNFYYEVLSRGTVIFSDVSRFSDISFTATQLMAPSSKLLVYQILPNSEVAADYLPFSVEASYPHQVELNLSAEQVRPGDALDVNIQTQGEARVGLVAVDRSVFILAENRLNLQQVFDELERLYMEPQVELHEARFLQTIATRGASETFEDAGVVVMTNKDVPAGEEYENPQRRWLALDGAVMEEAGPVPPMAAMPMVAATPQPAAVSAPEGLAEVQRERQFFPETWLWQDVTTDAQGSATVPVEAPDSITTWMLRAVGMSKEHGLGVAEGQLRVFQPFFLQVDLPYSAIRGEEFPVKIALYNYMDTPQEIFVEIEEADWFELLDEPVKSSTVAASDIGGVEFRIHPTALGNNPLKITARSTEAADAVIKELLVEPEGVQREVVDNHVLSDGQSHTLHLDVPADVVEDSARAYVAITGNYLTQTIEGLEGLIKMPFGCGEQNMILFAPNVFITRYLKETGQLKPEVMAKAEHMMITGYQRELTYMRSDGSFSAFGESDEQGSLWLTAFVLKTFSQAQDIMYIDQAVLEDASAWIKQHQLEDGSFENVGFLHHQELLGGLQGRTALTAYVAIALMEAGETDSAGRAVQYLEEQLPEIEDAYTMAITAYALDLADSPSAEEAYDKLMDMAKEVDGSLYWGDEAPVEPLTPGLAPMMPIEHNSSALIETTGYATLALIEHGDRINAARASRWLASQRNAFGGFGSTQDTVVALQALTAYSANARSDVDMTVTLEKEDWSQQVRVTPENADVLQTIQVPIGGELRVSASGRGDVVFQSVLRYNLPDTDETSRSAFQINVDYGTESVEVDDLITVAVSVRFTPAEPIEAGMVVLDISIPTGFAPEHDSIVAVAESEPKVKRFDVAGRKVIFYIEDMMPNESLSFEFQARALYPVRAKETASQAYSYYQPELKGETLAGAITVSEGGAR